MLSRQPTDYDLESLTRMHDRQRVFFAADPAAAEQLLAVGAGPRDATLDPVEQATLASVCLAIFNLDEALTRE